MQYKSGYGFPQDVLFDQARMQSLFTNKWFFVGTRADVAKPRDFFRFQLFDEDYFLVHGSDGAIRCMINRCAHQSARLVNEANGRCSASIICPNHQWAYDINSGALRNATGMDQEFHRQYAENFGLDQIPIREIEGMLFACLNNKPNEADITTARATLLPYLSPFNLSSGGYKQAYHHREVIDVNWLLVMINNRECCHCSANHKRLIKLFDPSSFNGATTPSYEKLFNESSARWNKLGLRWREDAFSSCEDVRVARYPMAEGFHSISFDGEPVCRKNIGPFVDTVNDASTLSFWYNPNAWIHITSDHIATNWVLPISANRCELYTSWIVSEDAEEGVDYSEHHMTEVWKVTNQEDVALCQSMNHGARSKHYKPGPFSEGEKFCTQFSDWYMRHSKN